jgi:hypothetical protein
MAADNFCAEASAQSGLWQQGSHFMEPARSDHNMCFFWEKADLLSDIEQIDAVKHDSFFSSEEFKTKNSKIKKCRVIQ